MKSIKNIARRTLGPAQYQQLANLHQRLLRLYWQPRLRYIRKLTEKDERFWADAWKPKRRGVLPKTISGLTSMGRSSPPASRKRRYIWASIVRDENHGNYLIEQCLKRSLQIPEPDLVIDAKQDEFPSNLDDYQFIVNPGTTTLHQIPSIDIAFRKLGPHKTPIVCFGASVWYREKWRTFLKPAGHLDEDGLVAIARKMQYPIGCRDPFTYDLLLHNGIKAEFIGCPTLLPPDSCEAGDYIAFSFGRDNIPVQVELLRCLSKTQNIKVLIHKADEEAYCQGLEVEIVRDVPQFLTVYHNARCVVTGRLHGALPGMSAHKPVFYFQGSPEFDSRLTLLNYLGLPIYTAGELHNIDTSLIEYDHVKVEKLRESFFHYIKRFKEDFSL